MFWHGRTYGHKTIFFLLVSFYKHWWREWNMFYWNSQNGMSAVADLYNLTYALYTVCFCSVFVVWYVTNSIDVDQSKDEK